MLISAPLQVLPTFQNHHFGARTSRIVARCSTTLYTPTTGGSSGFTRLQEDLDEELAIKSSAAKKAAEEAEATPVADFLRYLVPAAFVEPWPTIPTSLRDVIVAVLYTLPGVLFLLAVGVVLPLLQHDHVLPRAWAAGADANAFFAQYAPEPLASDPELAMWIFGWLLLVTIYYWKAIEVLSSMGLAQRYGMDAGATAASAEDSPQGASSPRIASSSARLLPPIHRALRSRPRFSRSCRCRSKRL